MQDLPDMHEKDALHYYKKGLKEAVAIQVGLQAPILVHEAEEMAKMVDNILFEHRHPHKPPRPTISRPPYQGPGEPTPMEIDLSKHTTLMEKDHEYLRKEGKCFYCHKGKHLVINCPS